MMTKPTYEEYLEMLEAEAVNKKAKKKLDKKEAKKLKKAKNKLKQLAAVATQDEIKSYTTTGKASKYTVEERTLFQARIENEKKNILRIGNSDPQQILHFCNANTADEKNFAVKYAREAAVKWAIKNGAVAGATPVNLPF